jgi:hypothetical protein
MHCPPIDMKYLAHLWKSEMKSDQICEHLGCTRGHLYNLVRKHRLGRRPTQFTAARNTETPDPTPDEIKERTAAIRATWTPEERLSRLASCYRRKPVIVRNFIFHRETYSFSP